MKKIKKLAAIVLATGLLLSSMTVFAAEAPYTSSEILAMFPELEAILEVVEVENGFDYYAADAEGTVYIVEVRYTDSVNPYDAIAAAEGKALLEEALEEGFTDGAQMQYAQAEGKSAGEYYNNAVVKTQGIEEAIPVAQGGKLVIDGKVTNVTASISKVTVAFVDSVRATQDGTVLNVVDVSFPAVEATINFYMPGVADGANIAALQYVDGTWVDVEVVEVRADHVVLNLKDNGVVAFIAK